MWCVYVALLFCVTYNDAQVFRDDYQYYQEADGWLKLHQLPAAWLDARLRCQMEGAQLASPTDDGLMKCMVGVMKLRSPLRPVFTGISALFSKGDFLTLEGVPLSEVPVVWAPGQPDNQNNSEDCILLHPNNGLEDVSCDSVAPYVCYKKKVDGMKLNACGTVDQDYYLDPRTGSCYKFHRFGRSWNRAFMTCAAEGGHLAIINSNLEAQVLQELFAKYPENVIISRWPWKDCAHVGITEQFDYGTWVTIEGQTLRDAGFENWLEGQPDNSTNADPSGEHCGCFARFGLLNDNHCGNDVSFICEKAPAAIDD